MNKVANAILVSILMSATLRRQRLSNRLTVAMTIMLLVLKVNLLTLTSVIVLGVWRINRRASRVVRHFGA